MNVNNASTTLRPESFRATCDNCTRSKVRCGKQLPHCHRCIQRGTTCVYRLSQRPRKGTSITLRENPKSSGSRQNDAETPPTTMATTTTTTLPTYTQSDDDVNSNMSCATLPLKEFADGFGTMKSVQERVHTKTPRFDTAENSWLCSPLSASEFEHPDMADLLDLDMDEATMQLADDTSACFLSVTSTIFDGHHTTGPTQHCPAILLSALEELGLPSASCTGDPTATQILGTVLNSSRSTLDSALKVVSCDCPSNASAALLVTVVVFRILCSYETILQSSTVSSNSSNSSSVISSNWVGPSGGSCRDRQSTVQKRYSNGVEIESSALLCKEVATNGPAVFVPPITIGAYELDEVGKLRFIVLTVLSELTKMDRLLDDFSKKFCRNAPMSGDNKSQLYIALEMFMRNRKSLTVLAAQGQLDLN